LKDATVTETLLSLIRNIRSKMFRKGYFSNTR